MAIFDTTAPSSSPTVGGLIRLDIPCTAVEDCGYVAAYAVLRDEVMKQEAVVAASLSDEQTAVVSFDNRSGYSTGVAVACPDFISFGPCSTFVTIRDQSGKIIKTDMVTIPLNGVMAATLPSLYPEVRGIAGTIEFAVSRGYVTALGYVFSPTGAFTSSPVFQPF
jgi:hypothetical protein